MGSTSKEKMDALKQTIKSLRSRRDYLEKVAETAEIDAQEQYTRYTHLDEQFKAERLHRIKLEEHLRSFGVEVDEHGNIESEGDPDTAEMELTNDTSPRANSAPPEHESVHVKLDENLSKTEPTNEEASPVRSPPPEDVHVKQEKDMSKVDPTNDASPMASSPPPVTVKIEKGLSNSRTDPTNDTSPVASSPRVTVKIEKSVSNSHPTLPDDSTQHVADIQPEDPTPIGIKVKNLTCQDITDASIDEHFVDRRLDCVASDHAEAQELIDIQNRYVETKVKKPKKLSQKRKDTTPLHDKPDAEPSQTAEKLLRSAKRIKLEPSAKPKPGRSGSAATSQPPTPSSSRSVRVRVKSRKLLGLE